MNVLLIAIIISSSGYLGYKIGRKVEKKRQNDRVKFAQEQYNRLQAQIKEYMINSTIPDFKERF